MISKRLKSFVVTVQEGSLAKAAKKMFTTAPPLSRQIKLLEEELGMLLFVRSNAGMSLTQQAADLYSQTIGAYNLLSSFSRNRQTHQATAP